MENNEIMNYEDIEVVDDEIVADGGNSVGTGVAMLIGAGLAFAVGAGVKLAKKAYAKYKENKKLKQPDKDVQVEPAQVEEVAAK
jgi:hypothetical protein